MKNKPFVRRYSRIKLMLISLSIIVMMTGKSFSQDIHNGEVKAGINTFNSYKDASHYDKKSAT